MSTEWNRDEDGKPGARLVRNQPEPTARGWVWTHRVSFDWPQRGYTYVSIRDCGDYVFEACNLYSTNGELIKAEDDGA